MLPAGKQSHFGVIGGFGNVGNGLSIYLHADACSFNHLAGVAQQAEAGYVGAGANVVIRHNLGGSLVERGHAVDRLGHRLIRGHITFKRGVDDTGAQRLGEDELVTDLGACIS